MYKNSSCMDVIEKFCRVKSVNCVIGKINKFFYIVHNIYVCGAESIHVFTEVSSYFNIIIFLEQIFFKLLKMVLQHLWESIPVS